MAVLVYLCFCAAVLCWLAAVGASLALVLRHPAPDRSFGWYAVRGIAFFDADNFAPSGAVLHGRMLLAMGGFVLFAGMGGLLAFLVMPPG